MHIGYPEVCPPTVWVNSPPCIMERNKIDDIAYFIAFCIEIYKNAHNISGAEVSTIFSCHGVMEFLSENFEVLHTQSPGWILGEIEDFINTDTK